MRIVLSVTAAAAVAVLAAGCSVSGTPKPVADLSRQVVPAAEFPSPGATAVPPAQVPGIVADITLRPLRGDVDPARCTPAAVETGSAEVVVGPGPQPGSTLTEMVVRTSESLSAFASAAKECATFTGGATGRQVVTTAIVSGPTAQNGADRIQIVRTLASPGAPESVTTLDQWIAQRGDVRVVVQLRYLGAADAAARATTAEFFETAVARAFGGG